jgi:hypothetical protein
MKKMCTNPPVSNSKSRSLLLRALLLISLLFICFGLSTAARAVLPAPDGGYPGFNTAEGDNALFSLTIGGSNTAIGFDALYFNTTGTGNTANGDRALLSNITGNDDTANGSLALLSNTTGVQDTATGSQALYSNITGFQNTALGYRALYSNTGPSVSGGGGPFDGSMNTAVGSGALYSNTTGAQNTANGVDALYSNTTGFDNTAVGHQALLINTTGSENTANGDDALRDNTTGIDNTATGERALEFNTTGHHNTALGVDTAEFISTGNYNILLGAGAGFNLTTGDNNIDIGNGGVAAEANTIRIGTHGTQKATFIAGIIGAPVAGATVHISGTGQLGIGPPSSVRFKDAIKPMDNASEAILALKPVTFHYKKELDPEGIPQFGLVAEDVEKVDPDLVARDDQGKVYTVRYEAVNAMLLNEFLKEHQTVQELKSTATTQKAIIAQLKQDFQSRLAEQQKQIDALTAGLQKVSAQLEVNKPLPQIVASDE